MQNILFTYAKFSRFGIYRSLDAIDTDTKLRYPVSVHVRHPSWDQLLEFPQRTDCNSRDD